MEGLRDWRKVFAVGITALAAVIGIGAYNSYYGNKKPKKEKKPEKLENSKESKDSKKESEIQQSQVDFNVKMMNLRTTEDWKSIIEATKDSDDLLSKTFLAEAFFRIGDSEMTKTILNSITKSEAKDSLDEVAIGKAHQLADDREKAFEWFTKSAAKENPIALYTLAVYYQNGIFVTKDNDKAQEYFQRAANLNEPISQYLLGLTLPESTEAYELFEKSASQNYLPALISMGDIATRKGDSKKAAHYFKISSDMNYCPGIRSYSYLLMNGIGVEKNVELGIELLEKAISLGDVDSSVTLSTYYQSGKGVEKNDKKAFEIINNINPKKGVVYYQLALFYLNGIGVEASEDKYLEHLKNAAIDGYPAALHLLGYSLLRNPSNDEEISMAIDYIEAAAQMNYGPAIQMMQSLQASINNSIEPSE